MKAGEAALKLECIGANAIPTLKRGIESNDRDVRYFAAEALAYLNDDSGVEILADAAANRPGFPRLRAGGLGGQRPAGWLDKAS